MSNNIDDPLPKFWEMEVEKKSSAKFQWLERRDHSLGVRNSVAVWDAVNAVKEANLWVSYANHALPEGILAPCLALPEKGFAPDYLSYGRFHIGSARLRAAMAQPDEVVQWAPVELVAGGEAARAQDYRWMRVLAVQEAIDLERSDCVPREGRDLATGEMRLMAGYIRRVVLLEGLVARTEIFCPRETYAMWLVTDGLAERVMRAGCTGVAFVDSGALQFGDAPKRYRVASGVVER